MNEKEKQIRRNNIRRLCRQTSGIHVNCIRININNTKQHELFKALECYKIKEQGHDFITEAVFENGLRADILDLDKGEAVEIVVSEAEESIVKKQQNYPPSRLEW